MKNTKKGFTLVELMVTVTILAILATLGSVAFTSYLSGVRDVARITALDSMTEALNLYSLNRKLPEPNDSVQIKIDGKTIAWQGYIWKTILEGIGYPKAGKDPKDDSYFSYYLTRDRKNYQLMAFLEGDSELTAGITSTTLADDSYMSRFPKVHGRNLWIMTDTYNMPIQEVDDIKKAWNLNVTKKLSTAYKARFTDTDILTASGNILKTVAATANCKRIKAVNRDAPSGLYYINPTWSKKIKAYCDMVTDGGGWTYVTLLADTKNNLFETGRDSTIESVTKNISTKWNISSIWIDNEKKDIMLQCMSNSQSLEWYKDGLVIYDYVKTDIDNLLKHDKRGTSFSSENLSANWRGNEMILSNKYWDEEWFTLKTQGKDGKVVFLGGNTITSSFEALELSPAFSKNDSKMSLSESNYCMVAIR